MKDLRPVSVTVNGKRYERTVESRLSLADFLRHELGLTGTHIGCEHGVCGACTVLVGGRTARACLMLAVQTDGQEVSTVEGLAGDGEIAVAARELDERMAMAFGPGTKPDRGDQLVVLQRGRERALREFRHAQASAFGSAADLDLRIEGHGNGGQLGGRIEMRQAAAQRAAIASLPVPDLADRCGEQRQALCHQLARLDIALARHRTYSDVAVLFLYVGKAWDAVEVDQMVGRSEPEVQHRHQRLAARQRSRIRTGTHEIERVGEARRSVVDERRRLQILLRSQADRANSSSGVTLRADRPCSWW